MSDFTVLPLMPSLAALGISTYTVFLFATAVSAHRFLQNHGGISPRDTAHVAAFALLWATASLPKLLAGESALPLPLIDICYALALASALMLPTAPDRRADRVWRFAVVLGACGILGWGSTAAYGLPPAIAAALLMARSRFEGELRRLT